MICPNYNVALSVAECKWREAIYTPQKHYKLEYIAINISGTLTYTDAVLNLD